MNDFASGMVKGAGGCLGAILMAVALVVGLMVWGNQSSSNRFRAGNVDEADAALYCGVAFIQMRGTGWRLTSDGSPGVLSGGPPARFRCPAYDSRERRRVTLTVERFCGASPDECTAVRAVHGENGEAIWSQD